jgi:hypothetical protein
MVSKISRITGENIVLLTKIQNHLLKIIIEMTTYWIDLDQLGLTGQIRDPYY